MLKNTAGGVGVKKHWNSDAGVLVATAADPKMPARPLLLLRCTQCDNTCGYAGVLYRGS